MGAGTENGLDLRLYVMEFSKESLEYQEGRCVVGYHMEG